MTRIVSTVVFSGLALQGQAAVSMNGFTVNHSVVARVDSFGVKSLALQSIGATPTGWFCRANDLTATADVQSRTSTTTTAVISGTTVSGGVINFGCFAY